MRHPPVPRQRRRFRRAFTLVEAAFSIAIVGTGVVATTLLFESVTRQNQAATRYTVAVMLAGHVEEMLIHLPGSDPIFGRATLGREGGESLLDYDDVDDFNGLDTRALAGPLDANRRAIPELSRYAQSVSVTAVEAGNLTTARADGDALKIEVVVTWQAAPNDGGQELARLTWYRPR